MTIVKEFTYYLAFGPDTSFPLDVLLDQLSAYLNDKERFPEPVQFQDQAIQTTHEQHPYLITAGRGCGFRNYLKVQTGRIMYNAVYREGLFEFIYQFLEQKLGFGFTDIEWITGFCMNQLRANRAERFLSFPRMQRYFEDPEQPAKVVVAEDKPEDFDVILTKAEVWRKDVKGPEHGWHSLAFAIDFDGWDRIAQEYAPMSEAELDEEIEEFANNWVMDIDFLDHKSGEPVWSVLRLEKSWNRLDYLIKTETRYRYLGIYVYVD